jgi:hypothetical protein
VMQNLYHFSFCLGCCCRWLPACLGGLEANLGDLDISTCPWWEMHSVPTLIWSKVRLRCSASVPTIAWAGWPVPLILVGDSLQVPSTVPYGGWEPAVSCLEALSLVSYLHSIISCSASTMGVRLRPTIPTIVGEEVYGNHLSLLFTVRFYSSITLHTCDITFGDVHHAMIGMVMIVRCRSLLIWWLLQYLHAINLLCWWCCCWLFWY